MAEEAVAERDCAQCGVRNESSAQFCASCDAYLGWDRGGGTLAGDPLSGTVPKVLDAIDEPVDAGPSAAAAVTATNILPAEVVTPAGATFRLDKTAALELAIRNASTVVDGFTISALRAPDWLTLAHGDAHLMPAQDGSVTVILGMLEGALVVAQRFNLALAVVSTADPTKVTEVTFTVTVPPIGPRLSLQANPALLRVTDSGSGTFGVRLDNSGANYPQTVALSGSDAEEVIEFTFTPPVVAVPAGQTVEAVVTFTAPEPPPDRESNRQLSIVAANDEGPITATLTLIQRTSPARVDTPVRVQLSPSRLRVQDAQSAEFDVLVDNRAGHRAIGVTLTGSDPERALVFAFYPPVVSAEPGQTTVARGRVQGPAPRRGEVASTPFTVVAANSVQDAEASGVLEMSAAPDPITTAALHLEPPSLDIGGSRRGTLRLDVDNRRSSSPLHVQLSGVSDDGTASVSFSPPRVAVAPQTVGAVWVSVEARRPPPNQTITRRLRITATDGVQRIEAEASLTQSTPDRRPVLSVILVLIGVVAVVIGAFARWSGDTPDLPDLDWVESLLRSVPASFDDEVAEPPARLLVLVGAVLMFFGLTGRSGGLTRKAAIVTVLVTLAFVMVVALEESLELGGGLFLIWTGALLGYVGGVVARRK